MTCRCWAGEKSIFKVQPKNYQFKFNMRRRRLRALAFVSPFFKSIYSNIAS